MKPITFLEGNAVYAENQPCYLPLPAHRTKDGVVTSCWKATVLDRLRIALSGRVYLQIKTFNELLQPCKVSATNPLKKEKP
jgi:hypothetical protein